LDECVDLLFGLSVSWPHLAIVVDALDEYADPWAFLDCMKRLIDQCKAVIKLFVSNKMHIEVSEYMSACTVIELESNSADLNHYIQTEVEKRERRLLEGSHPEIEKRSIDMLNRRTQNSSVFLPIPSFHSSLQHYGKLGRTASGPRLYKY
jgi:hypothetical protein